jgi:hypothetical protein
MNDHGNGAVQVHEAFQHRAVDRSRGVIHHDSKPAIAAEVWADGPLGLLPPPSGPLDHRHRRIVPPEPNGAHPHIGVTVKSAGQITKEGAAQTKTRSARRNGVHVEQRREHIGRDCALICARGRSRKVRGLTIRAWSVTIGGPGGSATAL